MSEGGAESWQEMIISWLPAWWRKIIRVRRPEFTQRSYRVRNTCLETACLDKAGGGLVYAPSRTMFAQEGQAGSEVHAGLLARPATPVEGEAGGVADGEGLHPHAWPAQPAINPRRGGSREEGGGGARWWWR
jgi:hypothetical protein